MALPRASRLVACLVAAAGGFALGVIGTEATFGQLRPQSEPPLLFSVEVRNDAGALLASPLLVGEEGSGLHLSLAQPELASRGEEPAMPALQMSLDLDPQPDGELRSSAGSGLCLGYRLSIDDGGTHQGQLHQGRVSLPMGETRSVQLGAGGETLHLQLTVARAGSKEFEALIKAARRRGRPLT
jgi:hypothetical protein